ncbi:MULTISPECIES: hypothetical protein [Spirosoma]|uniref:Proteophosphoglycan ppg4 n=1 Tax=Spirosoma sordidisoli TaxID=2502893 RepID=A0A4Q2UQA7_9BACT|nr:MULTISPECIES: hypothetical protein [Spirosoma]RYC71933.1 hypothetical protein EQG79_07365 [Spirosoma sordidisoli]
MKSAVIMVALLTTLASAGSFAQSGSSGKNSTKPGSSSGLQQSVKGGATSGGPSNGAGSIGAQKGSTTRQGSMTATTKSTSRKKTGSR